jgi:hypothetical protein
LITVRLFLVGLLSWNALRTLDTRRPHVSCLAAGAVGLIYCGFSPRIARFTRRLPLVLYPTGGARDTVHAGRSYTSCRADYARGVVLSCVRSRRTHVARRLDRVRNLPVSAVRAHVACHAESTRSTEHAVVHLRRVFCPRCARYVCGAASRRAVASRTRAPRPFAYFDRVDTARAVCVAVVTIDTRRGHSVAFEPVHCVHESVNTEASVMKLLQQYPAGWKFE